MDKFINESEKELLIKKVYEQMQDEISRTIYKSRSLYSLSDDKNVLKNIVRESCISKILLQNVGKHKHQKLCLFGVGTWGKAILRYFDDIDWDYLVDNGKAGMEICGKPIVPVKQLETIEECYFVVSILFDYKSVVNQLIDIGIKKDNILILGQAVEQLQYFDLPELKLGGCKKETFVDIGAFNGATSLEFAHITNGKYKKIYVLEPDRVSFEKCKENLKNINNCEIMPLGAWNKNETLSFISAGEGSKIIDESGEAETISAVRVDDVLGSEEVTYIKMDIEGAEINALIGAKNIICRDKPKLAISVYHKRSDIWEIPMLLLKYNPEYKFFLRVYSFTGNDTVLYAI